MCGLFPLHRHYHCLAPQVTVKHQPQNQLQLKKFNISKTIMCIFTLASAYFTRHWQVVQNVNIYKEKNSDEQAARPDILLFGALLLINLLLNNEIKQIQSTR